MKVLVTGATGFLGSNLVKALLAQGHQVVAIKRSSSKTTRIQSITHKIKTYDIDCCSLVDLFREEGKIDAIIHTAASYGRSGENTYAVAMANTFFPLQLLETAADHGCKFFINTDTCLPKNISRYSLSKSHFLEWGRFFADQEKFCFINTKLEHFYGPGDDESKFVTWVINGCLQNVPELKLTAGEQRRDFIYIDDVVRAFTLILQSLGNLGNQWFQQYELGSGRTESIKKIVSMIHEICQSKTHLAFGVLPYRKNEVFESTSDATSLKKLGWSPKISLSEGLKMTIAQESKFFRFRRHSQ